MTPQHLFLMVELNPHHWLVYWCDQCNKRDHGLKPGLTLDCKSNTGQAAIISLTPGHGRVRVILSFCLICQSCPWSRDGPLPTKHTCTFELKLTIRRGATAVHWAPSPPLGSNWFMAKLIIFTKGQQNCSWDSVLTGTIRPSPSFGVTIYMGNVAHPYLARGFHIQF